MSLPSTASSARVSRLLIAVLFVVLASVTVSAASAGSGCAQQIIEDWSDNGTIDGSYPTVCYQQAIAALPEDLRSYSSAADDISQSLQEALLVGVDESAGGGATGSSDPGSSSGQSGGTGAGESSGGVGGAATGGEGTPPATGTAPPTNGSAPPPSDEAGAASSEAAAPLESDGDGAGLPVPVIVLLVVAGIAAAAGLVVAGRRLVRDRGRTGV